MLPEVHTIAVWKECPTDGHSPLYCMRHDYHNYFVKYRSGNSLDPYEINCLMAEWICNQLLQILAIPTAELALITLAEHSNLESVIRINKRYLKPGIIALGSRELKPVETIVPHTVITEKRSLASIHNPADIVRIALFDLWVGNTDRHADNLNLLFRLRDQRREIVAIDHAFAFGSIKGMRTFNSLSLVSTHRTLFATPLYHSIVKYLDIQRIGNDFIDLLASIDIQTVVEYAFAAAPATWKIDTQLVERIIDALKSADRLMRMKRAIH